MNWRNTTAAVIPCYNEASTIPQLVQDTRNHIPHVFVVDDGSRDSTASEALAAGAFVLRHPQNRGKGAALQTGLSTASQRGFQWTMLLDGDGQHCPEDIPRFLSCADTTGAPLVIGDRFRQPRSMPWLRRTVNVWMSRELSRLAGYPLADTQCGFRLVNLAAWRALPFRTLHFEVESEMVLSFVRASRRIEFVPVQVLPRTRPTHIRPLLDTWRWFKWRSSVARPCISEPARHVPRSKPIAA
jgi:glycosyltransferase involved in cell wall biosynthesis